jgi:hypothetical protein
MAYLLPLSYKLCGKDRDGKFINYMINSKVIILIYKIIIAALVIVASVVVFREIKSFNKYILYTNEFNCYRDNEHLLIVSTMFYDEKIFCIAMYLICIQFCFITILLVCLIFLRIKN